MLLRAHGGNILVLSGGNCHTADILVLWLLQSFSFLPDDVPVSLRCTGCVLDVLFEDRHGTATYSQFSASEHSAHVQGENKINRRELACLSLTNLPSLLHSKLSTYPSFRNDQLFCEHTGLQKFLPLESCMAQTVSSPVPAVQVSMLTVPFPPAYKRMHCAICHLTHNKKTRKLVFILNGRMPPSFSGCVFSKT